MAIAWLYTDAAMTDMPIMLRVAGRLCVIVGGGEVGARRAAALLATGARLRIIAPRIDDAIKTLDVEVQERAYRRGDLDDAMLVVAATDDPQINGQISHDAAAAGVLVNRADRPELGDFAVPAHHHHGPITIAVHTGGVSASAGAKIRRELSDALDADWPRLIELAGSYRARVQQQQADQKVRREKLKKLTDTQAMSILKTQGTQALVEHYEKIVS